MPNPGRARRSAGRAAHGHAREGWLGQAARGGLRARGDALSGEGRGERGIRTHPDGCRRRPEGLAPDGCGSDSVGSRESRQANPRYSQQARAGEVRASLPVSMPRTPGRLTPLSAPLVDAAPGTPPALARSPRRALCPLPSAQAAPGGGIVG